MSKEELKLAWGIVVAVTLVLLTLIGGCHVNHYICLENQANNPSSWCSL